MQSISSQDVPTWRIESIGKKFYQRWLFRGISHDFNQHPKLAISGPNGSGKSTLLRILAGQMLASEGSITMLKEQTPIRNQTWYRYLSWAAPYINHYPVLSLAEAVNLHYSLKPCLLPNPHEVINLLGLSAHQDKPLRLFSSGMYQRAMVGLAVLTDTPILLLDEPTSNLDQQQTDLILQLIDHYAQHRIVVMASNLKRDLEGYEIVISLTPS